MRFEGVSFPAVSASLARPYSSPRHLFSAEAITASSDEIAQDRAFGAGASLTASRLFLGFFDGATKFSGQNRRNSGKRLPARDYMAFNWQHPIVSERTQIARPNGIAWAHAFGIKVLPFLAETSR